MEIRIIEFEPSLAIHFRKLNEEWLQKYFVIEEYDEKLLANPEKIINDGGRIFFAVTGNDEVIGTASLIKEDEGFELSKMAVTETFKGRGIGNLLMEHCIAAAKELATKKVFLLSNRSLTPALTMYKKYGFAEVPIDPEQNPYQRGDIKMELIL